VTLALSPIISSSQHDVGPGVVRLAVRPSLDGRTTLSFPPLGRVTADTHDGPVRVTAELREVDVQPIISAGGRLDAQTLSSEVQEDLPGAVVSAAIRAVVVAAVIGAIAVAVLPKRGGRRIAGGAAVGAITMALLIGSAYPGYDATRFEAPTYEGSLAVGGSLLNAVTTGSSSGLNARVDVLADKLANLYSASITSNIAGSEGDVAILHISDLHLNPIGVNLARQMASSFGVDAVVDTGDTTSFGLPFEQPFSQLFGDFDVPYYFVAGNHDSMENRAAIAAAPGVTAIDRKVVDVKGVRILGFDDPVVTTTRIVPKEERAATMEAAEPALRRLTEEDRPDVVATHNPAMASAVAGEVPLVIAGHLHRSVLTADQGTLVAVVGSTGATGLGSLTVESEQPYLAEVLRFRDGDLVAIDNIELKGTLGDFVVERTLVTDEMRHGETDEVIDEDPEEPTLEDLAREGEPVPTVPGATMPANPIFRLPTTTTTTTTTTVGGG
jgi:predicted phosphodiesterase